MKCFKAAYDTQHVYINSQLTQVWSDNLNSPSKADDKHFPSVNKWELRFLSLYSGSAALRSDWLWWNFWAGTVHGSSIVTKIFVFSLEMWKGHKRPPHLLSS